MKQKLKPFTVLLQHARKVETCFQIEEGYTGPMAQIHERQIYVMTFGLYFEVPAKKIEISKKKYIFGPD